MAEKNVSLAIISEPPRNLIGSNTCFLSSDGVAALIWRPESSEGWNCRLLIQDEGFVVIHFGDINVTSCYFSPNANVGAFSRSLDNLNHALISMTDPLLVCGDFNARSVFWGSPTTNRRGELVERWSAVLDIRLLNTGRAYTCIRPQGCSIVDLSWSSVSLLERIENWSVLEDVETLSDHQYVEFTINGLTSRTWKSKAANLKRWNFKKLDDELFSETLELLTSASIPENLNHEPEKYVEWLMEVMKSACNVAAPLVSCRNKKRQMYWWSGEVACLRGAAIRARRLWTRSRWNADPVDVIAKREAYSIAKKALRNSIRKDSS